MSFHSEVLTVTSYNWPGQTDVVAAPLCVTAKAIPLHNKNSRYSNPTLLQAGSAMQAGMQDKRMTIQRRRP
jgi:hypothetical protein